MTAAGSPLPLSATRQRLSECTPLIEGSLFTRDYLLENLNEEEFGPVKHTDMLLVFGEACGATRECFVN